MASVLGHYSFDKVVSVPAYRALASPDLSPLILVTGQNHPSPSPQHTFLFCSSLDTHTFSFYDRSQQEAIKTSGGVDDQSPRIIRATTNIHTCGDQGNKPINKTVLDPNITSLPWQRSRAFIKEDFPFSAKSWSFADCHNATGNSLLNSK